jgi:Cu/Ag efflux pump CusA
MIDSVIIFSIRFKLLILSLTVVLITAGTFAIVKLPLDAVPNVTNNQVLIITQKLNLVTYEMEKFVTTPIELAFNPKSTYTLSDLRTIQYCEREYVEQNILNNN